MKGTEYFLSLYTSVDLTEEYDVIVTSEELNWHHRICDAIAKVSHKPTSSPGSNVCPFIRVYLIF
jgi:hypothetical protein